MYGFRITFARRPAPLCWLQEPKGKSHQFGGWKTPPKKKVNRNPATPKQPPNCPTQQHRYAHCDFLSEQNVLCLLTTRTLNDIAPTTQLPPPQLGEAQNETATVTQVFIFGSIYIYLSHSQLNEETLAIACAAWALPPAPPAPGRRPPATGVPTPTSAPSAGGAAGAAAPNARGLRGRPGAGGPGPGGRHDLSVTLSLRGTVFLCLKGKAKGNKLF